MLPVVPEGGMQKEVSIFLFLLTFGLHVELVQAELVQAALVELIKINNSFVLDVRYATTNNFTGKKVYPSARCFLQKPAALALDQVQKELARHNFGLKIFDAYRPLSVQKIFWEIFPNEKYVADPKKGSRHNRGCAVDVTLINLTTKQELIMPSGFDDFSEKATRNYDKMEPEARKNCEFLETVMGRYGFKGAPSEWWHFDYVGPNTVGLNSKRGKEAWREFPISDIAIDQIELS